MLMNSFCLTKASLPQGFQTICLKFEGFVWEYYELRIESKISGEMLIFFFKINVKLPQLLWFVVLVAVNGECWRF